MCGPELQSRSSSIRQKGFQRRLADLELFTLGQWRHRGLLIETLKILIGFSELDPASEYELSVNRMRDHGYKLLPPSSTRVVYGYFPMIRVCNLCNSLPDEVLNVPSINAFKRKSIKILPAFSL